MNWENIRKCTMELRSISLAKCFNGIFNEIVGTSVSVGCTIEKKNKEIVEIIKDIEFQYIKDINILLGWLRIV